MIEDKVFKTLVGKIIYGIPLSNAIKRGVPLQDQIREFTVIKVSRVNVILIEKGYDYEATFKKDGLSVNNYGYDFYETIDLANGYFIIQNLRARLNSSYNLDINLDQAIRINEILDEKIG